MAACYKTFISVGNAKQPFSRLFNIIEQVLDILPQPILVQCGHTPYHSKKCQVIDFINMDSFSSYVLNAQILILHAGAGSILHALQAQKKPIVMPRRAQFNEHVNDHQVSFAMMLHAEEKAIMVNDETEFRLAINKLKSQQDSFTVTSNKRPRALDVIQSLLHKLP